MLPQPPPVDPGNPFLGPVEFVVALIARPRAEHPGVFSVVPAEMSTGPDSAPEKAILLTIRTRSITATVPMSRDLALSTVGRIRQFLKDSFPVVFNGVSKAERVEVGPDGERTFRTEADLPDTRAARVVLHLPESGVSVKVDVEPGRLRDVATLFDQAIAALAGLTLAAAMPDAQAPAGPQASVRRPGGLILPGRG